MKSNSSHLKTKSLISKQQVLDAAWSALLEENKLIANQEDIVPEGFLSYQDFATKYDVGLDTAEKTLRKLYLEGKLEIQKFRRKIAGDRVAKIIHYKPKA